MNLTEAELRTLIKATKKTPRTLYGKCPKCGKNEFGISLKGPHLFGCFRKKKCGFSGNIFSLLKFLGVRGFQNKKNFVGLEITSKLEQFNLEEFEILPKVILPMGFRRIHSNEYLESRGYQKEDFENYICGITTSNRRFKDRIIIGFQDEGRITGHIARSTDSKEELRYLNTGKSFGKMLDGLTESEYPEATLVEGHFDRIQTRNNFRELGIESRVIATFGAKISDYQINLLLREGITRLNLFFDTDVHKIIIASSNKLLHKFEMFNIMKTTTLALDPGDMDVFQTGEAYISRENFIKFATTKLPQLQL